MVFMAITGGLFVFGLIFGFFASFLIDKNPKILKILEKLF